jgi:rare lipoprotein A
MMGLFESFRWPVGVWISALVVLVGCAGPGRAPKPPPGYPPPYQINGKWYQPRKSARDFRQRGIASWYGREFHGQKTSSGQIYDMHAMTGAHKTLPLGTYVSVHNLRNGKRVVVRINDRGPFVRGRIIDLSYGAAKQIGLVGPGTAPVEVVALGVPRETTTHGEIQRTLVPSNYYVGDFSIQVGAFREKENALRLKSKLASTYQDVHIMVQERSDGRLYKVYVARCKTLEQARQYEKILEGDGYPDAMVVAR